MEKYVNLEKYREKAGLSQTDMAKLLNISRPFYNQLENGNRRMDLAVAKRIAAIIGTKLGWPASMSWLEEIFFTPKVAESNVEEVISQNA